MYRSPVAGAAGGALAATGGTPVPLAVVSAVLLLSGLLLIVRGRRVRPEND